MLTTLLMFIAAVSLSGVAGYYSVIGLTTIFSSAFIPVLIMAGTLETSKVITASWLYNNWRNTPFLLKSYLTAAVMVLMFITSLGIFGFLSKAHVEQAAANAEQQAKILRITQEIDQQAAIIASAKQKMANAGKGDEASNAAISARIDDANKVIDSANSRMQTQIDEQQKIIDDATVKVELRVASIQSQIDDVDKQVANLDAIIKSLIDQKYAVKAQAKQTEQKAARDELAKQKSDLLAQIDAMRQAPDPVAVAAKAEITRLRSKVDEEVKQTRAVIDQLTAKLSQGGDTAKIQADIDAQSAVINAAESKIETLNADKFTLETEGRKLEAETGPIKYIAQAMYGNVVDQNLLEHAVRWIIMLIIVVFDPLALLMLIAANQGLAEHKVLRAARKKVELQIPTAAEAAATHVTEITAAAGAPPMSLVIEGKDELITAVTQLKNEIAELNAFITQPAVDPTVPVHTDYVKPVNHTVSFDSQSNILKVETEHDDTQQVFDFSGPVATPDPVVKIPVTADDIAEEDSDKLAVVIPESQWQIIDTLPDVSDSTNKSTNEFFEDLQHLHKQRIERHLNNKSES